MRRKQKQQTGQAEQSKARGFDPLHGGYLRIDTARWSQEHDIRQIATDEGRNRFPPTDQVEPDQTHAKIQSHVEDVANSCREEVGNHLTDLMTAIEGVYDEAGLKRLEQQAEDTVNTATREYDTTVAQDETTLKPPLEDMRSQRQGVEAFRKAHQLGQRQADYAERRQEAMWVGAIAVVEIVLNAVLLGEVMPYGIGGALGVVCFITAINVALGYVITGPWWRRRNHVEPEPGQKATLGCIAIGAGILAFNVCVGQFRDAMETFGEQLRSGAATHEAAMRDIWRQAIEAPWSFDSFQAMLVVVVGVGCFVLAAVKGYRADDEYPGYGKITRALKRVEEGYRAAREEATAAFEDQHKRSLAKLDDLLYDATAKREQYDSLCQEGRKVAAQFVPAMQGHAQALRELTQIYRDTNRKHRGDAPVPQYFEERRRLDDRFFEPVAFEPPARPDVNRLATKVGAEKQRLHAHYETLLKQFYPIG